MTDLTTRPATLDDAAAVAELSNVIDRAAGGDGGSVESEYRALLSGWVGDAERNTRLVFHPNGDLIAAAMVAPPPPGGQRVDMSGGVHPDHRRQGVGRELLAWQMGRARDIYQIAAAEVPWRMQSGANAEDVAAGRLLTRSGFQPVRYFIHMKAPVAAALNDPVTLPDGLRMTSYSPALERAVYEAHMEAFADHWGYQQRPLEQWGQFTFYNEAFRPEMSRIVLDGDEVAAYTLGYEGASPSELYIGQVGTRRPWRRRGLAQLMLSDVLIAARDAGLKQVDLEVDADSPTGAVGVYERAGFAVGTRYVAYESDVPA